jgi:hypothetical protein
MVNALIGRLTHQAMGAAARFAAENYQEEGQYVYSKAQAAGPSVLLPGRRLTLLLRL